MPRADDWEHYTPEDRWRLMAHDIDVIEARQATIDDKLSHLLQIGLSSLVAILGSLVLLIIGRL